MRGLSQTLKLPAKPTNATPELCRKRCKSALDSLAGQLDAEDAALKPNNGRARVPRPAGVESLSEDEDDLATPISRV